MRRRAQAGGAAERQATRSEVQPSDLSPARRSSTPRATTRVLGVVAAAWGIAGVFLLIGRAVTRLAPMALDGLRSPGLTVCHWVGLAAWVGFMGYYEGYKGFQRAFSPRVVGRALHLAREPRLLHALLAPLFVMGLIHATRRRLITSWSLVATMVALVLGVRLIAQPVRGLIDVGVVFGLVWGLVAVAVFWVQALGGRPPGGGLDLPTPTQTPTPTTEISTGALCASGG